MYCYQVNFGPEELRLAHTVQDARGWYCLTGIWTRCTNPPLQQRLLRDKRWEEIPLRVQNTLFLLLWQRSCDRHEKIILHNLFKKGYPLFLCRGYHPAAPSCSWPCCYLWWLCLNEDKVKKNKSWQWEFVLISFWSESLLNPYVITSRLPQSKPGKENPAPVWVKVSRKLECSVQKINNGSKYWPTQE